MCKIKPQVLGKRKHGYRNVHWLSLIPVMSQTLPWSPDVHYPTRDIFFLAVDIKYFIINRMKSRIFNK